LLPFNDQNRWQDKSQVTDCAKYNDTALYEISPAKNKIQSTGVCVFPIINVHCIVESEHTNTIVFETIAIVVVQLYGLSLA